MNKQEDSGFNAATGRSNEAQDTGNEATRADEAGDVAEPDAPTGVEENAGMNTILGGGSGTGVQEDASDE
jgi:hypothetical protein